MMLLTHRVNGPLLMAGDVVVVIIVVTTGYELSHCDFVEIKMTV